MLSSNTNIAACPKTTSTTVRDTIQIKTATDIKTLNKINAETLFNINDATKSLVYYEYNAF